MQLELENLVVPNTEEERLIDKVDAEIENYNVGELGGHLLAFMADKKIGLHISDRFSQKVKPALLNYIKGDYSGFDYLVKIGRQIVEALLKMKPSFVNALTSFFKLFESNEFAKDRLTRSFMACVYKKYLLDNYTEVEPLNPENARVLGHFHFHDDGSEPSQMDLENSKHIYYTQYIFSPQGNNVSIYHLIGGECTKLLEGKLEKPFNGNCEEIVPDIEKILNNLFKL